MIAITGPGQIHQVLFGSIFTALPVGLGDFTCCTRFHNHETGEIDPITGDKIKIRCDKEKIANVLYPLLQRFLHMLKNKYLMFYRYGRAQLIFMCRGLNIQIDEPTTWEDFCEEYVLDPNLGKWPTNKQCRKAQQLPPIYYAVWSGNVKMVEELFKDDKADANFRVGKGLRLINVAGKVELRGFTPLHCAISQPDDEEGHPILEQLAKKGANPHAKTRFPVSPIGAAISLHQDRVLTWMVENHEEYYKKQFDFTETIDVMGSLTCLYFAVQQGELDWIKAAERAGANFDLPSPSGSTPWVGVCNSALDTHWHHSPATILEFLHKKELISDINFREVNTGPLRFFHAICRKIFRLRLRFGQDYSRALTKMGPLKSFFAIAQGKTPLHLVCQHGGRLEVLDFLIKHKAELQPKNTIGLTPLNLAMHYNNVRHATILAKAILLDKMKRSSFDLVEYMILQKVMDAWKFNIV